jgi:hypothetical protein
MAAETHGAKQDSESLDLRNLIETIPALVVCALPGVLLNLQTMPARNAGRSSSAQPRCTISK